MIGRVVDEAAGVEVGEQVHTACHRGRRFPPRRNRLASGAWRRASWPPVASGSWTSPAASSAPRPLYAALSEGVAADEALSGLLLAAPSGQRQPVLLFACVHWLLLNDADDPLAAWYPNLTNEPRHDRALEAFTRFVPRARTAAT